MPVLTIVTVVTTHHSDSGNHSMSSENCDKTENSNSSDSSDRSYSRDNNDIGNSRYISKCIGVTTFVAEGIMSSHQADHSYARNN